MNDPAERIFSYLSETDQLEAEPYDAVIGFGMFDLDLPRFCGRLYAAGHARRIVFTGGIGAGTGDLGGPEADIWRKTLRESHPDIPNEAVIIENRSTNTGENVQLTAALLARDHPEFALGSGLNRALVVASPSRLRRVWLTLRMQQPSLRLTRRLPTTTFEREHGLYTTQRLDYLEHLCGELDRIEDYANRGWIVTEAPPASILAARSALRAAR